MARSKVRGSRPTTKCAVRSDFIYTVIQSTKYITSTELPKLKNRCSNIHKFSRLHTLIIEILTVATVWSGEVGGGEGEKCLEGGLVMMKPLRASQIVYLNLLFHDSKLLFARLQRIRKGLLTADNCLFSCSRIRLYVSRWLRYVASWASRLSSISDRPRSVLGVTAMI